MNLMLEYNIGLIEREVEGLYPDKEDIKNIMILLEMNHKKEMNTDIFKMLYELVVSKEGQQRYVPIV
jgi:hypothetical protein